MNRTQKNWLISSACNWFRDEPNETASEWACRSFTLSANEGRGQGPFTLHGREYLREIIDCFSDRFVEDVAACLGTQIGKTASIQAGVAFLVARKPCGILWVLPTTNDARNFSAERWMGNVRASPELRRLVPTGSKRHDFAKANQQLGGTHIAFVGSNSPSGLAGRPRRVVVLDEMEKFPSETRGGEAGSINLACQRTKDAAFPKRIRTSSPAAVDGPGWVELMRGDLRRWHVPCPGCGTFVVLAWSRDSTELPVIGTEAWAKWDEEAKGQDGRWDLDRVEKSMRFECPKCGFHIKEEHKTKLNREGKWIPTKPAPKTWRSYHLPSWYSPSPSTTFGLMATTFLESMHSLDGLHGWINGNAAEPWVGHVGTNKRTEMIAHDISVPVSEKSIKLMTIDCQQSSPHFYFVVRQWDSSGTGNSRLIEAGTCNSYGELEDKQLSHEIADTHVAIDSSWSTESVYSQCVSKSRVMKTSDGPALIGWIPVKGQKPGWLTKHKKTNTMRPHGLFRMGVKGAKEPVLLLEFDSDRIWSYLHELRKGPDRHGVRWEALESVPEGKNGYWSQMDAKYLRETQSKTGVVKTVVEKHRSKQDHWLDCEIMQVACAMQFKLLRLAIDTKQHGRTTVRQGTGNQAQA